MCKYDDYFYLGLESAIDYERVQESFYREINAMKLLNSVGCPYVPTLYGYKENSYIIKEYVDGETQDLYIVLNNLEDVEDETIESFNSQLQELKKYCDELGIIARDCNENNIMIVDGTVKVIDLGDFIIK